VSCTPPQSYRTHLSHPTTKYHIRSLWSALCSALFFLNPHAQTLLCRCQLMQARAVVCSESLCTQLLDCRLSYPWLVGCVCAVLWPAFFTIRQGSWSQINCHRLHALFHVGTIRVQYMIWLCLRSEPSVYRRIPCLQFKWSLLSRKSLREQVRYSEAYFCKR